MFGWPGLMRSLIAVAVVLGLVAQGRMPAAPWADPLWALGGICGPGHGSDGPNVPVPDGLHHHGVCCQLGVVAGLVPDGPAMGPVASVSVAPGEMVGRAPHVARRWPAYASRAPPGLA